MFIENICIGQLTQVYMILFLVFLVLLQIWSEFFKNLSESLKQFRLFYNMNIGSEIIFMRESWV